MNKYLVIEKRDKEFSEIEKYLKEMPADSKWVRAKSYKEAVKIMLSSGTEIIFADTGSISLEDLNSLNSLIYPPIPIVVVSDTAEEAVKSYNTGLPVDFILRPYTLERMIIAVSRALKYQYQLTIKYSDYLFLKSGRLYKKFMFDEIIFIEAYGTYSKIYTNKGKFIVNDAISKLEERLGLGSYLRVHKSFIVNTRKIVSFDASNLELELGKVPIGRNYKNRLDSLINMFVNIPSLS